jgi:hypothetical protein
VSDRRGHIKLSRKLFEDDPWWNEKRPRTRIEAWLDVLYLAAFRARVHMTTDGPIPAGPRAVRRQLPLPRRPVGLVEKAVRTWIETGKKWARIRAQRETHAGTVYVIVNYDLYQSGGTDQGTAGGTVEGTEGAQLGHSRGTRKKQLSSKAVKETWLTPFGMPGRPGAGAHHSSGSPRPSRSHARSSTPTRRCSGGAATWTRPSPGTAPPIGSRHPCGLRWPGGAGDGRRLRAHGPAPEE